MINELGVAHSDDDWVKPTSESRDIIWVTRSQTKRGDPMWILDSEQGDQVFCFGNQMWNHMWVNSGYLKHFSDMEPGDVMVWKTNPIRIRITSNKQYPDIIHIDPKGSAVPDESKAPCIKQTHYPQLYQFLEFLRGYDSDPVIINVATSALSLPKAEIVQVSVVKAWDEPGAILLNSMVRAKMPNRLLVAEGGTESPSQINGILPYMLMEKDMFDRVYDGLVSAVAGKDWIVWGHYAVKMLDSASLEYGRAILPRRTITDVSPLFSALYGGKWNPITYQYDNVSIDDIRAHVEPSPLHYNNKRDAVTTSRIVADMIDAVNRMVVEDSIKVSDV